MKKHIVISCCSLLFSCYNAAYHDMMQAEIALAAKRAEEQAAFYTYATVVVQEESKLRLKALELKAKAAERPYVTMDTDKDGFQRMSVNQPANSEILDVPLTFAMVPAPVPHKLIEPKMELAEGRKLGETVAKWFTIGYLGGELFGMVRDVASGTTSSVSTVTGDTTTTTTSVSANKQSAETTSDIQVVKDNTVAPVTDSNNTAQQAISQTTISDDDNAVLIDEHTEENGNYDVDYESTSTWESTRELDFDWRATWPSGEQE